jgi:hypothetical protein
MKISNNIILLYINNTDKISMCDGLLLLYVMFIMVYIPYGKSAFKRYDINQYYILLHVR